MHALDFKIFLKIDLGYVEILVVLGSPLTYLQACIGSFKVLKSTFSAGPLSKLTPKFSYFVNVHFSIVSNNRGKVQELLLASPAIFFGFWQPSI